MASALVALGHLGAGVATPALIVGCVIVGAVGAGITIAAWQAFVPQLVPPEAIISAVRLNAHAVHRRAVRSGRRWPDWSSREFGPGTAFLANALSFLAGDRRAAARSRRDRRLAAAGRGAPHFRDGLRYVRKRAVLTVAVLGALFSSLLGRVDDPAGGAVRAPDPPRRRRRVRAARRGVRRRRDHRLGRHHRALATRCGARRSRWSASRSSSRPR